MRLLRLIGFLLSNAVEADSVYFMVPGSDTIYTVDKITYRRTLSVEEATIIELKEEYQ